MRIVIVIVIVIVIMVQAVVFEASQPLSYILRDIKDNIANQRNAIEALDRAYTPWNNARSVTPEMKRREDALREVIQMLNLFQETIENLNVVDKSIEDLNEILDDIAQSRFN